jgi:predicted nucleic acid-binding protein
LTTPVFVDTSAIYAVLDADDDSHAQAARVWPRLVDGIAAGETQGITHAAVVVEATALVQRRLGMNAVRDLHDELLPVLSLHFVEDGLHGRAVTALLAADRRDVSLVDWTSFELMRAHGVRSAFAFDEGFTAQGFALYA